MTTTRTRLIATGLIALAVGGCSTQPTGGAAADTTASIHVSRAKDYTNFTELRKDSTAVVQVVAGDSRAVPLNGVATTLTSVTVARTLWGKVPAKQLQIQQLGSTTVKSPDTSELLRSGDTYILFVRPAGLDPDQSSTEFSITGDRGVYRLNADQYISAGGAESALPARLSSTGAERSMLR